jgi:hypothetical protein
MKKKNFRDIALQNKKNYMKIIIKNAPSFFFKCNPTNNKHNSCQFFSSKFSFLLFFFFYKILLYNSNFTQI